jgi:O-methyltransferase
MKTTLPSHNQQLAPIIGVKVRRFLLESSPLACTIADVTIKQFIRRMIRMTGFDIVRYESSSLSDLPEDLSDQDRRTVSAVRPFTMTSIERIAALIEATRYVASNGIEGAIVECGVWRGGSTMAALLTLKGLSHTDRDVYLYDTFSGMSEPTDRDVSCQGVPAAEELNKSERGTGIWCYATLEDVRANVFSTGYPEQRIHFIRGKVEDTIPATLPGSIALLRLDTDWYESTRHELEHLFPLLHPKGVLIVDDYGHWEGARKAIDEFFQSRRGQYFFHRIDYTGRLIMRTYA